MGEFSVAGVYKICGHALNWEGAAPEKSLKKCLPKGKSSSICCFSRAMFV